MGQLCEYTAFSEGSPRGKQTSAIADHCRRSAAVLNSLRYYSNTAHLQSVLFMVHCPTKLSFLSWPPAGLSNGPAGTMNRLYNVTTPAYCRFFQRNMSTRMSTRMLARKRRDKRMFVVSRRDRKFHPLPLMDSQPDRVPPGQVVDVIQFTLRVENL